MSSEWTEKIQKIQTLITGGPEERQMALTLLDALVDPAKELGLESVFEPIFSGMTIGLDNLSIPDIFENILSAEKKTFDDAYRWRKDPKPLQTLLSEDVVLPMWEVFFRMYPERIQELPTFLVLEGVHTIPDFCGPDSPVKALGFSPPLYGFSGLEKCTHIKRVHFYKSTPTFLDDGFRWYYRCAPSGKTLHKSIQAGVDTALSLRNVEHLFAFNIDLKPVENDVSHLISTNLEVDLDTVAPNIQYAAGSRADRKKPLQESVKIEKDGQWFFQTDPIGLTNGNLQDHPQLIQSSRFVESETSYGRLMTCHTSASFLEHSAMDADAVETIVRFYLNEHTKEAIGNRVQYIEIQNASSELMSRILKSGLELPNVLQIQIVHSTNTEFIVDKSFLNRFPSLQVFDIVGKSYGYSRLRFSTDLWSDSCTDHPIRWLRNSGVYDARAIGFRKEKGSLVERWIYGQMDYQDITEHLQWTQHVEYMRLRNCENLAVVQENTLNMKDLQAEHNSNCDIEKVMQTEGHWLDLVQLESEKKILSNANMIQVYRPTTVKPIASIESLMCYFQRKALFQRDAVNRTIRVQKAVSNYLADTVSTDDSITQEFFAHLDSQQIYRFGKHSYYCVAGVWHKTTYASIDEKYDQNVQTRNIKDYNLDRAFTQRPFEGTMPSVSRVQYNTSKVPLSALKSLNDLSVLKIERPLDLDELEILSQLESVEELYFVNQGFTEIPSQILKMKNLRSLFLWGNKISSLPTEIQNLENLEVLSLTGSPIYDTSSIELLQSLPSLQTVYGNTGKINFG